MGRRRRPNKQKSDTFHEEILGHAGTEKLLNRFTVVRLDALSEQPIRDVSGKETTAKDFAADLDISYRPGIVLFDKGREVFRIDGMLRNLHFQHALRYVTERYYEQYPPFGGIPVAHEFSGKRGASIAPESKARRRVIARPIARSRNAAIGCERRASRRKIHV